MALSEFIAIIGLYVITVFTPGPAKIAIIAISLTTDRARGLAAAAGVTLGSVLWSSLSAVGFAAAIVAKPEWLFYLRIFGAAYLFWIAILFLRAVLIRREKSSLPVFAPSSRQQAFGLGFLVHITNPNAAFFWVGLFAFAVGPNFSSIDLVLIVGTCGSLGMVGFAAYALLTPSDVLQRGGRRARRIVAGCLAFIFAAAALRVLWQALA